MSGSILRKEDDGCAARKLEMRAEGSVAVIDLSCDFKVRKLYLEHPYFLDVLRWMNKETNFENIQHNHTDRQFRSRVLPELQSEMYSLGLLKFEAGKVVPAYTRFELRNVPRGPATQMVFADHIHQSVLRRTGSGLADLKINQVRTKATKEQVSNWMMKLNVIYSEIESAKNESEGEFVTFASLVTVGD